MKQISQIAGLFALVLVLVTVGCDDDSTEPTHFAVENWDSADAVAGGQLYDKWWPVNGGATPTSDFGLWSTQTTNTRTGGDTWRCKECHGWDYIGKDGRYASGSHFTGFDGVWTARTMDRALLFDGIKDEGGTHDLSGALSDLDVLDLARFIVDGLVDMSLYMDSQGVATGDTAAGHTLFTANCASCHGADGLTLDFSGDAGVQGVGYLANDNPQETLHKIRWGHPGTAMPSMVENGLTDDQTGDILAYGQSLPPL